MHRRVPVLHAQLQRPATTAARWYLAERRRYRSTSLPCRHAATMSNGGRWALTRVVPLLARLLLPVALLPATLKRTSLHVRDAAPESGPAAARLAEPRSPALQNPATTVLQRAARASSRCRRKVYRLACPFFFSGSRYEKLLSGHVPSCLARLPADRVRPAPPATSPHLQLRLGSGYPCRAL